MSKISAESDKFFLIYSNLSGVHYLAGHSRVWFLLHSPVMCY